MKNIISTLILLILTVSSVQSEGFYVGARASQMDWDSAILKGAINQEKTINLLAVAKGNPGIRYSKQSNIDMKMYGLTASYIQNRISYNYGFNTGNSDFNFNQYSRYLFTADGTSINAVEDRSYKAKRMDHDFSASFLILDTGFYAFGGLKMQSYDYEFGARYDYRNVITPNLGGANYILFPIPNNGNKMNFTSYGPAIGLGFSKALTDKLSINISAGLIYMVSKYHLNGFSLLGGAGTATRTDGTQASSAGLGGGIQYFSDSQNISINGYTLSFNLNYKLGNGFLQFGLIRQASSLKSNSNNYLTNWLNVEFILLMKSAFNINEKDVFQGITLGYQHNLF